jgi:predicted metalloprotease
MDFDKMRESENVEDRRGQRGNIPTGRVGRGGGGARLGLGGLVIVVVGSLLFGLNPADVLNGLQGVSTHNEHLKYGRECQLERSRFDLLQESHG